VSQNGADDQCAAESRGSQEITVVHPAAFEPAASSIEELPRLRAALGGGPRRSCSVHYYLGPGFGGNKIEKVGRLLAEEAAAGGDHLRRGKIEPRPDNGGALRKVRDGVPAGVESSCGQLPSTGTSESAGQPGYMGQEFTWWQTALSVRPRWNDWPVSSVQQGGGFRRHPLWSLGATWCNWFCRGGRRGCSSACRDGSLK
jgi:hypothetical protein